jgi:hypothetical protein
MRLILISSALVVTLSGTSFAEPPSPQAAASVAGAERGDGEWHEFSSLEDRFSINFPGEPTITETTWLSQFSAILPARVYSGTQGAGRYSVTVVDYHPIERVLTERSRTLPALDLAVHDYGIGYWKTDVRSAVVYATSKYLERDGRITSMLSNFSDLVSGMLVHFVNNPDQSRTYASIYMHDYRLFITEATVPRGYPPPLMFQQSLGWLDENGGRIRYVFMYYPEPDVPKPPIRGR